MKKAFGRSWIDVEKELWAELEQRWKDSQPCYEQSVLRGEALFKTKPIPSTENPE